MLNKVMVEAALKSWQAAGLYPPSNLARMTEEFLNRFRWMDEKALKYVTERLMLNNVWPTFNVIAQTAEEYRQQDKQYVYVDCYGELEKQAYRENETMEELADRIGKKYFPEKDAQWRQRHAFTLSFFGVRREACRNCNGTCPHNGHQYGLRYVRGTSLVVPWASLDLCSKYKQTVDREGRAYKCKQQDNWTRAGLEAFYEQEEPPEESFFPNSSLKRQQVQQTTLDF